MVDSTELEREREREGVPVVLFYLSNAPLPFVAHFYFIILRKDEGVKICCRVLLLNASSMFSILYM